MKVVLYAYLIVLTLMTCSDRNRISNVLDDIDTMLVEKPDSAYELLKAMSDDILNQSRSVRMRYALMMADAQNKAYINFTTDTIMTQVAKYYDVHGTREEQAKAHYLLGCTYRDMGDAPNALQCYNEAIERSDTTSKDVDYRFLGHIYGQMTDLYCKCFLPRLSLETIKKSSMCMLKAKDTLQALIMEEDYMHAYTMMGKTDSSIIVAQNLLQRYSHTNRPEKTIYILLNSVQDYIRLGNYRAAMNCLERFEYIVNKYSCDVTLQGKASYLCYKGAICECMLKEDSAQYYYHKALETDVNNITVRIMAYRGLMNISSTKNDNINTKEYAQRYCEANDSSLIRQSMNIVNQLDAMYKYNLKKEEMASLELQNKHFMWAIILITILFLLILFAVFHYYMKRRDNQRREIIKMNEELLRLRTMYGKAKHDYGKLSSDYGKYKEEKAEELEALHRKLYSIAENNSEGIHAENEEEKAEDSHILFLRECIKINKTPRSRELHETFSIAKSRYPEFWSRINDCELRLTDQELMVCVLIKFHFATSEIAFLMTCGMQRITNIKAKLNKQLFGICSARGFDISLHKMQ